MANDKKCGNFKVGNHRDVLVGEKIAEYHVKEISGNGAGSQEINFTEMAMIARIKAEEIEPKKIGDTIVSEINKIINNTYNKIGNKDFHTIKQKKFICAAIVFLILSKSELKNDTTNRIIGDRWFVENNKFGIKHRNTVNEYANIVETVQWSDEVLAQMKKFYEKIISLIF